MVLIPYRLQFTQSFLFFQRNALLLLQIDLKLLEKKGKIPFFSLTIEKI